jgi:hypothetical protein
LPNDIFFHIPSFSEDDSGFRKPEIGNYHYWVPMIETFLKRSNRFEIHCWNDEFETIEEIKSFYNEEELLEEENITIFKGAKTISMSEYLLNDYLNNAGKFKWFTVNLNQGEETVFHSGHWATEFYVPNIKLEELELIKNVTPLDINL